MNKGYITWCKRMSNAVALPRSDAVLGLVERAEAALRECIEPALGTATPGHLRDAIGHAVFAGGSRLRPTLCLAVASAHGDPNPATSNAAAVSVELMHCASLVHDDLPCFDDAMLRRGLPTVHAAYGVASAVLAGDALIVLAFEVLSRGGCPGSIAVLAEASGPARGLIAGQALELEGRASLDEYHRAKTASLFRAAAMLGALSADACPTRWSDFGDLVGRAYQAADDVVDAVGSDETTGKTVGRDEALRRPSVVRSYGLVGARRRIARLLDDAARSIPPCPADRAVRAWLARLGAKMATHGATGAAQR